MSLINLSEEYVRNFRPPLYEKLRIAFDLDLYWASSLSSIEKYFQQTPPRKKDRWSSQPSAYVVIRGLEVKRMHPDSFEEEDGVSLSGLDEGLCLPLFEVQDETIKRLAYWMAGNSSEYLEAQEEFGFNREVYVPIPKMFLQYRHDDSRGWLAIKSLDWDRRSQTERKTLKDKILELIPEFPTSTPQPIY